MTDGTALYRQMMDEVWTKGNVDAIDDLHTPDFVDHRPVPGFSADNEGIKAFVTALRAGFPDASFTVDRLVAEGDQVVGQWTMTATHTGEFNGIPATGRSLTTVGVDMLRVRGDRFSEIWHLEDLLGMLGQLGLLPAPPG